MPAISDEPFTLVIFGASGDLTRRKLVPALWSLYAGRTLPEPFAIIGSARSEVSVDEFRRRMHGAVREFARVKPPSANVWDRFASSLSYVNGDPADPALYASLDRALRDIEKARPGAANRLFYLATPPSLYDAIVENLGASGLARPQGGWTRAIVEKPFGHDYDSARALNHHLGLVFREEQIYRIDHYLGKETVQNLLVLRFANGIFEPLWNRSHVAEVQITVAETIGVETRGAYYEEAGALRDMMQNHLLQLLCLLALEPPVTFDAGPVHDEKNKVMRAIRPIDPRKVDEVALRGQYGPGFVGGKPVPGYRQELEVRTGHLRGHRQRDTLVGLDADHELVGIDAVRRVAVKDHVRRAMESDGDLAHPLGQALAGAQVEGHAGPAPVVDNELAGNKCFGS